MFSRFFGSRRHLSDIEAARYRFGELSLDEVGAIEKHYSTCDACALKLVATFQSLLVLPEAPVAGDAHSAELPMPVRQTDSVPYRAFGKWLYIRPARSTIAVAATLVLASELLIIRSVELRLRQTNSADSTEATGFYLHPLTPSAAYPAVSSADREIENKARHQSRITLFEPEAVPVHQTFVPPAPTYWDVPQPVLLTDLAVYQVPIVVKEPIHFNTIPHLPAPRHHPFRRVFTGIAKTIRWLGAKVA